MEERRALKSYFYDLLRNERGFHRLFSDQAEYDQFSLYYNDIFVEDPIFNHFVLENSLLEDSASDRSKLESVIENIRSVARSTYLGTTIFIEDFWPGTSRFEKTAVEAGYAIADRMEVLCKPVHEAEKDEERRMSNREQFVVSATEDYEAWNEAFMASYMIPPSWHDELLKRERLLVQSETEKKRVKLIIAKENSQDSLPIGCLLTFNEPHEFLGIYSVGTIPEMRGRGIARKMLVLAEELAIGVGCIYLTLQTLTSDHVSGMYKKLGYRTEFERDILWAPRFH